MRLLMATALAICLAALTQFLPKSCWIGAMRLDAARELARIIMCGCWPTQLIKRTVHVVYIGLLWLQMAREAAHSIVVRLVLTEARYGTTRHGLLMIWARADHLL